jgi:hypothetical protein
VQEGARAGGRESEADYLPTSRPLIASAVRETAQSRISFRSQQFHTKRAAGRLDSAIDRGNRDRQPACKLEINYIVSLQVIALAEVYELRGIELKRQCFQFQPPNGKLRCPEFRSRDSIITLRRDQDTSNFVMPKIGDGWQQLFSAYSFEYAFGVPAVRTAARQKPIDRYTRIKNKALSGHIARRGLP